jgi:hypothetical protein
MNLTIEQTVKSIVEYFKDMTRFGEVSDIEYQDDQTADFNVEGFRFSVMLCTNPYKTIGGMRERQAFELSYWTGDMGSYWNPPEEWDVVVGRFDNVGRVVNEMAKSIIDAEMEGLSMSYAERGM